MVFHRNLGQISSEEVPDFISAYLNRPAANPPKHSSRGRPRTMGNHQYRPSRQSLPVPRYNYNERNRQANRSDIYPNFNRFCQEERSSYHPRYSDRDRHHLYSSPKPQHQYNQVSHHYNDNSNVQHNAHNMSTLNTLDIIGSLQSQIRGLHSQPLQQATLYSINTFDGTKKAEFATWVQSIETTVRICDLDAININLSKLQGAPL